MRSARLSLAFIAAFVLTGGIDPALAWQTPPKTQAAKPLPTLREGDSGDAVEILQQALNGKLEPSAELSVDGDFGPATRAAVIAFQRARKLEPTGVADSKTWDALAPLPARPPAIPPPSPAASALPAKLSPDALDGPPFVSLKAWVIVDGKTGGIVAGKAHDAVLEMASTTKMMTALVVMKIAKTKPGALDEMVTFSERADKTAGSTSDVHAGERLPVRELLFGLLLPSGNDASVALAEHFGAKLGGFDANDSIARFIEEMNKYAAEVELKETHYANPHGLSASGHHSSARNLATLARLVLADQALAECVSTRRHGCTLVDANGGMRLVIWNNTNRLLGTEGYDGVKTGSTAGAGSCLVASGRRGDDHLIIVGLGGASSDSRDADIRNLFRWAWLQRGHGAKLRRMPQKP